MKSGLCPSCGAPVTFHSAASIYLVCRYCKSTVLRQGAELGTIGQMPDVANDDPSLIRIGTEGMFGGQHFVVQGRIQMRFMDGFWNEWHLVFDDNSSAWLSETTGQPYSLTRLAQVPEPLPAFENLLPDMPVTLMGQQYFVGDMESAYCIASEGELPFQAEPGSEIKTVDLRHGVLCANLDYSEAPPLLFLGRLVDLIALKLSKLKEAPVQGNVVNQLGEKAYCCPHCQHHMTLHSNAIQTVACPQCGTVVDLSQNGLVVHGPVPARVKPSLPLESHGSLFGIEWHVIGCVQRVRSSGELGHFWTEYLLYQEGHGFAWLMEEQGHWTFFRPMTEVLSVPSHAQQFVWQEQEYRLFNQGRATIGHLAGEFHHTLRLGEACFKQDYVAPPHVLTRERQHGHDGPWLRGDYLDANVVAHAFAQTSLPRPTVSAYRNQPNAWQRTHRKVWHVFLALALLLSVLQAGFLLTASSHILLRQALSYQPDGDAIVSSSAFTLEDDVRNLVVRHGTNVRNNWLSLATSLVNKDSGETLLASQEGGYYAEASTGSRKKDERGEEVVFRAVPAGHYYLAVEYQLGPEKPALVLDQVEVERDPLVWSNFVLALLALLAFPIASLRHSKSFEARRWAGAVLNADDSPTSFAPPAAPSPSPVLAAEPLPSEPTPAESSAVSQQEAP